MNQTNQQDYQDLYQNGQQPPSQKHTGCIVAVVVGGVCFVIIAVLVAILVPAMIGYTRKSNLSTANSTAKSCSISISTALVDLDEEDKLKKGNYIITNDPGFKNVNVPFDTETEDELLSLINKYQGEDANSYYYFAVVEGAQVTYTAVNMFGRDTMIGTYPVASATDTVTQYDGAFTEKDKNRDIAFLNLYRATCDQLRPYDGE